MGTLAFCARPTYVHVYADRAVAMSASVVGKSDDGVTAQKYPRVPAGAGVKPPHTLSTNLQQQCCHKRKIHWKRKCCNGLSSVSNS